MYSPIEVLYEDPYVIVFDKPPGLLVIPTPKGEKNTLISLVNRQCRSQEDKTLHPCHRIDRDTSGAIIFAKGKSNQKLMMNKFHQGAVEKKYVAFVQGRLPHPCGEIRMSIRDYHQEKFAKHSKPKPAVTQYKIRTIKKGFTVAEVVPKTGRTNQIRIHFSTIGHPLLGERLYAFGRDFAVKFRRLALHASELVWRHPVNNKTVKVFSPLPADMQKFLATH